MDLQWKSAQPLVRKNRINMPPLRFGANKKVTFDLSLPSTFYLRGQPFPDRVGHRASQDEAKAWRNDKTEAFHEYLFDR